MSRRRKPPNRGGRPTRFTTDIAVALAAAFGRGQTPEAAAKSTGVGSSTVFRWLALGRAGDPRFAALAELAGEAAKVRKARKPKRGRKGRRAEPGGVFDWASFRGMF
jgi:hypothetical protein